VNRSDALRGRLRVSHGGTEYLFCGIACRVSFQEDPRRLLGLDDSAGSSRRRTSSRRPARSS
jgi:YHS domain-containing protein